MESQNIGRDQYYADRDSRLDTLAGPDNAVYWRMLARLSDDYAPESENNNVFGMTRRWDRFADWCEESHGFRPQFDPGGGITGQPNILDPDKYLLFLLKYGGS